MRRHRQAAASHLALPRPHRSGLHRLTWRPCPGGRSHDLHHRLRSHLQRHQETAGVDYPPHSKGEPDYSINWSTALPVASGPRFETGDRTRGSVVTCSGNLAAWLAAWSGRTTSRSRSPASGTLEAAADDDGWSVFHHTQGGRGLQENPWHCQYRFAPAFIRRGLPFRARATAVRHWSHRHRSRLYVQPFT